MGNFLILLVLHPQFRPLPTMVLYFQLSSGTGRKLPLNGNNNRENTNRHYLPFFAHKKNTSFEKSYGNVNHALRKTGPSSTRVIQFRPVIILISYSILRQRICFGKFGRPANMLPVNLPKGLVSYCMRGFFRSYFLPLIRLVLPFCAISFER